MKQFRFSGAVAQKLIEKHDVTREEVNQCFMNRSSPSFEDRRAEHRTDPPTFWFVAETDRGRVLKVVYIEKDDHFAIKSAFEPKDGSDALYEKLCRR